MDHNASLKVGFYQYFPGGGIGRYTHELATVLNREPGIEVEVLCNPRYEWLQDAEYATWPYLYDIHHASPVVRKSRFLTGQLVSPKKALAHARKAGIRIIHLSNINHLSYPTWRPKVRQAGLRLAISVHDVKRGKAILNRSWETSQLRRVYQEADILFVHSEYQKQELIDFSGANPGRMVIVPHGPYDYGRSKLSPSEARMLYGLAREGKLGIFFGQIRDDKNLGQLLEALTLSGEKSHLLIAGRGGGKHHNGAYYQQMAKDLGLADRVTFMDRFIDSKEVPDLFAAADWVALPYRESFTSQSGVLNVAAVYGKPILTSNAPVLKETVEAAGIGVVSDSDRAADIAASIDRLMGLIDNGHDFRFDHYIQNYSWHENARVTREAYLESLYQLDRV